MSRRTVAALALALLVPAPACAADQPADREPIIGLPCEGCEGIFEGMPEEIPTTSRIAPKDEPGEPMLIEGIVRDEDGRPVEGVIVYAYHTDAEGVYPRDDELRELGRWAHFHGRLRGWARSDANGRYGFTTIRPGAYPDGREPQHVHMHVLEPGRCTYYIGDLVFEDDPRLTRDERENHERGRGGNGLASPLRDPHGRWLVDRDVILGKNVPGYPQR